MVSWEFAGNNPVVAAWGWTRDLAAHVGFDTIAFSGEVRTGSPKKTRQAQRI
jgi:hypothetical protein